MSKIIIKNNSDISDITVLECVKEVINDGRISNNNKQYCYLTVFKINGIEHNLETELRECSDVFTFYKSSRK